MGTAVGVNLLWLRPRRVGGSEDYAVRLLLAIADEGSLEITLFAAKGFSRAYLDLATRFEVVTAPFVRFRILRVFIENTWLAVQCKRRNIGVIHHLGGTVPLFGMQPALVTIHDLQPLDCPEHFGIIKRLWLRFMLPWAVRRAACVVTVSEYCRERISARLGVHADRIAVVPAPLQLPDEPVGSWLTAVQLDLAHPFLFYPAVTYPHKNHEVLLRALALLQEQGVQVALVSTGIGGPLDEELDRLADELEVGDCWHRLGRMSRPVMQRLYRQAVGLTFPSRYEGYGLPVVEAMVLGCPVLAANVGAIREVVGSDGCLLDPDDPQAWAKAIVDLLDDSSKTSLRKRLIDAGTQRAQELATLEPAVELCALYEQVAHSQAA